MGRVQRGGRSRGAFLWPWLPVCWQLKLLRHTTVWSRRVFMACHRRRRKPMRGAWRGAPARARAGFFASLCSRTPRTHCPHARCRRPQAERGVNPPSRVAEKKRHWTGSAHRGGGGVCPPIFCSLPRAGRPLSLRPPPPPPLPNPVPSLSQTRFLSLFHPSSSCLRRRKTSPN